MQYCAILNYDLNQISWIYFLKEFWKQEFYIFLI
jgi:hypothetical protein